MKNANEKRTQRIPVLLSPFELIAVNSLLAYYNRVLSHKISAGELFRRAVIHDFFAHQDECIAIAKELGYAK